MLRMKIGRVCWAPAVKFVTMISSNDSAKANSPPATSAVPSVGRVTCRNVCQPFAPRSMEASTIDGEVLRSRATTLL